MKNLIAACVHNPVFVNVLLLLILLSGGVSTFQLVREMFPKFELDIITVAVPYPGAGPEEVEEGICLKLEEAVEGIEGVKRYFTSASEGMGSATIEVEEDADVEKVKDDVTNKVNAIPTFPEDAERPIISTPDFQRDAIGVSLNGYLPEAQLKELAEDIKDEMIALNDVSKVVIVGARRYEISIEISEENLRQYGLTFDEVSRAVRTASLNLPGGRIRSDQEEFQIRTMGRRYTGKDYANIVVKARPDGTVIRLDQIADIRDDFEDDRQIATFNGKPSVTLQVLNSENEDAIVVAGAIKEYIKEKNKELPPTVQLTPYVDASEMIQARIDLLTENGALGLCLVFLLLWLFLDLRLAFWVSLGIPISLAGALAMMGLFGMSINMISLFSIIMILGIIVDDAIVVGESIYHQRTLGNAPAQSAIDGSNRVAWPVIAAVVTTIVAFVPMLFISGIMGNFMRIMPEVVIVALAVSLIEALIILPAHLRDLPDIKGEAEKAHGIRKYMRRLRRAMNGVLENFYRIYRPFLSGSLRWRYITLAVSIAILLITIGVIRGGFVKFTFFPKMDSDWLIASVDFPSGTPLSRTEEAVDRMRKALREVESRKDSASGEPLVESILGFAGSQFQQQGSTSGSNVGQIIAVLLPTERRGIHSNDIVTAWEKEVGQIPGAKSINFEAGHGGPGGKSIELWFMGDNMDHLIAAAEQTKSELEEIEGVYQIEDDFRPGRREVRARLKPEAHTLGLTNMMLGQQLRQGFYGDESVRIQRGRDDVKVKIRYPIEERKRLADFENIRIRTPAGEEVPVESVADVQIEQGYATITRKDGKRRVRVLAEVDSEVANAREIVGSLQRHLFPELKRSYPGMEIAAEGQDRETRDSLSSLAIGYPLAMLGIFMILATIFRSYIQPVIIMITIPFGIIGAVAGHLLLGYDLSMMSLFGLVALSGIVVNDAIVLIEQINHNISDGMDLESAIIEGGVRRFRAVMLTTATTFGGLLPLMLEKDFQAQFLIPMALSIAAGVVFATLLTLIQVPCLLLILNDIRRGLFWLIHGRLPSREALEPATERNNGGVGIEAS